MQRGVVHRSKDPIGGFLSLPGTVVTSHTMYTYRSSPRPTLILPARANLPNYFFALQ